MSPSRVDWLSAFALASYLPLGVSTHVANRVRRRHSRNDCLVAAVCPCRPSVPLVDAGGELYNLLNHATPHPWSITTGGQRGLQLDEPELLSFGFDPMAILPKVENATL